MRAALLVLLLAPAVAFGQAGRFLLAAGEVTLVRGAQEIRAAAGTAVETGDTIRVGPRSNVQLRMSDQQIIALRSDTVFRIDEYVYSERGDDASHSIFSLLKGGMRTVSGAIARRQQSEAMLRTSARPEPSGPQPAPDEKAAPRDEASESKLLGLIKAPLRTVAGALTPTRHAVRTPTATIGVRGTHYTVVHCDNDCFETRRTSVASTLLAQSDAGSLGIGNQAPNGTYGGVSSGLIVVLNSRGEKEIGVNGFFYVASADSPVQSLIAPPGFLYDRLDAQQRSRGLISTESSATMARSGVNAESRPSETPTPPRPAPFVVTEQRTETGAVAVVPGAPGSTTPPVAPPTPKTVFLSAFTNATGGPDTVAAFVDASAINPAGAINPADAINLQVIGDGIVLLNAFNVPAGSTANPATGAYSGNAGSVQAGSGSVQDYSFPNALGAYWGIWFDGSAKDASGTTTFSSGNFFHYLVAPNTPPEVVAAKRGTLAFDLVPGTLSVTNNLGEAVLPITGRIATVNFDGSTIAFDPIRFSFPSQTWDLGASGPLPINIDGRGASVHYTATGACTSAVNGCGGAAKLDGTASFIGPVGDILGHAFHARTTSGIAASMQGTAISTSGMPTVMQRVILNQ